MVCVDSGYEIHVGGAAGLHIKGTEILCKGRDRGRGAGASPRSSSSTASRPATSSAPPRGRAGRPRLRSAPSVSRTGTSAGRSRPLRLFAAFCQYDPWAERAAGRDAHEFKPLADPPFAEVADDDRASAQPPSAEWLDIGAVNDIPRRGARVRADAARRHRGVPHRRRPSSRSTTLPAKGGPLSQGIVHGHAVTCPLHNWSSSSRPARRWAPTRAASARSRCRSRRPHLPGSRDARRVA